MSPYESENHHFYICEELFWKFGEDCIKLVDCFWKYGHFCYTYPTDPRVYNLFPSSDFFSNYFSDFNFLSYKFFTYLARTIPRFYVIWSYYERCCFHDFFLSTSVYMKNTEFCELFFFQAILLEEFINCWSFLSDFLMFIMYATILPTNKILWLLLFQFLCIWYSLVIKSCTS